MDRVHERPRSVVWHRPDRMLWRALAGTPHAIHRSLVRRSRSSTAEDDDVEAQKLESRPKGQPAGRGGGAPQANPQLEPAQQGQTLQSQALQSPPQPRTLATLPPELLLCIVEQLGFSDIVRLRRSSLALHKLITPNVIRSLYNASGMGYTNFLTQHCRECLAHKPEPTKRLETNSSMRGYPLSSVCVTCARRQYAAGGSVPSYPGVHFRPGRKIHLADGAEHWVCRWCGWPVAGAPGTPEGPMTIQPQHEQFHGRCYSSYSVRFLYYFLAGLGQLALCITGTAMTSRFFRHEDLVFWPGLINFFAMFVAIAVLMARKPRSRTYATAIAVELMILGLWIAPCYRLIVIRYHSGGAKLPPRTASTLNVVVANMAFRFFNVVGNIFLLFQYDLTRKFAPGVSVPWRVLNVFASGVIFWTYPQVVEQKYPPDWH